MNGRNNLFIKCDAYFLGNVLLSCVLSLLSPVSHSCVIFQPIAHDHAPSETIVLCVDQPARGRATHGRAWISVSRFKFEYCIAQPFQSEIHFTRK